MQLKRKARTLKPKALAPFRRGFELFNGHIDSERTETILRLLKHSSKMLLKALLFQKGQSVFDAEKGTAIGIEKSLTIANLAIKKKAELT